MIKIENLEVKKDGKKLLDNINLLLESGKTYAIIGQNGAGKSTLLNALMGNPSYEIFGEIFLEKENIKNMKSSDRAKKGFFLANQNIPEIPGIKISTFLREIYNNYLSFSKKNISPLSPLVFRKFILKYLDEVGFTSEILDRDLNVGFSGGEKKRFELLQLNLLSPKYIFIDEIDSGVDVEFLNIFAENLKKHKNSCILIASHNFNFLEKIGIDKTILLKNGQILEVGNKNLLKKIQNNGFNN